MESSAWIEVRIIQKRLEAEDVVSMVLASKHGASLPHFEAGAHIDLEVAPGIIRQYSLCTNPEGPASYEIAVLREPASRGGSQAVHDALQVGQIVRISAPRNHFPLTNSASRSLLFAGGIGITPILCMAEHLQDTGAPYAMHYCGRTAGRLAYADRLARGGVSANVQVHLDDGPAAQHLDLPAILANPDPAAHLYVCGPGGFINAVLDAARQAGWSEDQLHREFFAAPADWPVSEGEDTAFTVVLSSSGLRIAVSADKSIVEALDEQGIFIPTSCSEGICGTCVINVIEGTPDHRDFVLSSDQRARNDRLTTCCSRAKSSTLVLDL
jgi:vanillate O-demethylase ferredoxin subunit